MDQRRLVRISKFLSLVLRHKPEEAGVSLDRGGWVEVDELLRACTRKGLALTRQELGLVVTKNDKQRFRISPDGRHIRALYGHSHSLSVQLGYRRW